MFEDTKKAGPLERLQARLAKTQDAQRPEALRKRNDKGYRTARENLEHLVDSHSFVEYGQLAVAAQRSRKDYSDLQSSTASDGVITGLATVNAEVFGKQASKVAIAINDYTVLAGTQGYYHHLKLDRILEVAAREKLPIIMYTEGGGGRPGDTDVLVKMAGLDTTSFATWAKLSGQVLRIAVNNGYCFAGNAALFGCADITIATKSSWIGMAGPAMIEGGGLGNFAPSEIGPIEVQTKNGVIDIVANDESHATELAQQVLGYFQGATSGTQWEYVDQTILRDLVPADRRFGYDVREVIRTISDNNSFLELRADYGQGFVTGLIRIEGQPLGIIANSTMPLGGAIDATGAEKACRFVQLCDTFNLPVLSLTDTPGFMVGPESEKEAAVRRMAGLFIAVASITVPLITIVLRKGYGLGAMAMCGGSSKSSIYTAAWPGGEFGGMGLEGAVRLGYKKELAAQPEGVEREALFKKLLKELYEQGRATEAATYLEIDAVIDPAETRTVIVRVLTIAKND